MATILRKEIEPQFEIAKQRYSKVLKLILDYTDYCDKNGDEDNAEYNKLEEKLHKLTGKNMSQFDLWEWWEADGAENLSFDISLPKPQIVENITKDELAEIVRRLKTYEEQYANEEDFKALFYSRTIFGNGFFEEFLKLNFRTYKEELFQSHKDKSGNYFEYSIDEVVEKIWNKGSFYCPPMADADEMVLPKKCTFAASNLINNSNEI
jgi:hypothetical protein